MRPPTWGCIGQKTYLCFLVHRLRCTTGIGSELAKLRVGLFLPPICHRSMRVDRAHKSNAIDFCSSLSIGHPQRLTCLGICGFGSGSISSLAAETAFTSKSARATGFLPRALPTKSPISQMSCSGSPSLHSAEVLEGSGRKAPGFGFAGFLLK